LLAVGLEGGDALLAVGLEGGNALLAVGLEGGNALLAVGLEGGNALLVRGFELGDAALELGVRLARGAELALGQPARLLGLARPRARLIRRLLRALALAILVVDQPLAVGTGAVRILARAIALLAHSRQLVGPHGSGVERRLELSALLGGAQQLLADALQLGRPARLGRQRLRSGAAGQRQVDDQLSPHLQLGALGDQLAAVPLEGREPRLTVVGRPRLVVEHGHEAAAALALMQPQHGPHEAPSAQSAPVSGDLQAVAGGGEPLDHERRIGCRAIRNRRHPRSQASALLRITGFETTYSRSLLTPCRRCSVRVHR
jgi:hypothetical protein